MLTAEEIVAYETRVRVQKATFALIAGVCLVVGSILSLSGPTSSVNEATLQLIYEHKRAGIEIGNSIATSIGYGSLGWLLVFLFRASSARNEGVSRIPPWCGLIAPLGATLLFFTGPVYSVMIIHNASQFIHTGLQTYMEADHLTHGKGYVVVGILLNLGLLLLAIGFIITVVFAMRVGLLPRILGWTGAIAGALVILPIGGYVAPFLQAIWLLAVVWLLAGRWSSGTPEAWATGTAVPWLSPAQVREQQEAEENRATRKPARSAIKVRTGIPEPAPVVDEDAAAAESSGDDAPARTRASTPKRKRKHRR